MEKNTDLQIDKTKDELIAQAGEAAANYFRQGLNCAEAVLWSCMDMHSTELPREVTASSMQTAFSSSAFQFPPGPT